MNLRGIQLSDDGVKNIIADLYLEIQFQKDIIDSLKKELDKGFNMKLTKLPNGTITITPEGNEAEILQWVDQTLGTTFLKDYIQGFVDQRKAQKDYDEMIALQADIKSMAEADRTAIISNIKEKSQVGKDNKVTPVTVGGKK